MPLSMTSCSPSACTVNWYRCAALAPAAWAGATQRAFQVSWPGMGWSDSLTVQSMPRCCMAFFQARAVRLAMCCAVTHTTAVLPKESA
ncbi:MAG: hypothetical protein BGO35_02255 [Burkholderiales bacterium 64-34]|nr:MAG: hypothetical protein BGO35_02255 [Burkholderiales bacterium 64-34]